jgi:hypothetical protein
MRKELDDRFDPTKPALIVLCGATKRKHLPLVGDVIVLGRGGGCDLGLVSPEVAPVHCLILRIAGNWRIKDCSGRATRVNGKSVQDEVLHNTDVIQIGTFSFEAHLPPGSAAPPVSLSPAARAVAAAVGAVPAKGGHDRLQRSRKRLVELALSLRAQLREARVAENDLARREHDLEEMERRLRSASQERQAQLDRIHQAEARLDLRKSELDHFSEHLRKLEQRLRDQECEQLHQVESDKAGYEADLIRARIELDQERRDLAELRVHLEQRQGDAEQAARHLDQELAREREQLEHDREELAGERTYLDQQRKELTQLRAEVHRPSRPEVPCAVAHDTQLDATPDRMASARRLLKKLSSQRRAASTPPPPSRELPMR